MSAAKLTLRFFLDEGVPDSVGRYLSRAGHAVIYLRDAIPTGSADQLVCAASEANEAILVAMDGDMKKIAQRHGVGQSRFRRLNLIRLACRESRAATRLEEAMSLVEHEWSVGHGGRLRRIFIEILDSAIRTNR